MNDVYIDKPGAWCPNCISFKADCNPDYEDYGKPCDRYQPIPVCAGDPTLADIIVVKFYEERPIRFSALIGRVKVREIDPSQLTATELEKVIKSEKRLGRTYEISRQTS